MASAKQVATPQPGDAYEVGTKSNNVQENRRHQGWFGECGSVDDVQEAEAHEKSVQHFGSIVESLGTTQRCNAVGHNELKYLEEIQHELQDCF